MSGYQGDHDSSCESLWPLEAQLSVGEICKSLMAFLMCRHQSVLVSSKGRTVSAVRLKPAKPTLDKLQPDRAQRMPAYLV